MADPVSWFVIEPGWKILDAEKAGFFTRAEAAVEAPIQTHEHRMNIWRRAWFALRRLLGR